jgi:hypothetical protein
MRRSRPEWQPGSAGPEARWAIAYDCHLGGRPRPKAGTSSAFIDLLFANSGIEDEIVRRADRLEVLPDVFMPVASIGHLIALKERDAAGASAAYTPARSAAV